MHDKSVKIRKDGCDIAMGIEKVAGIDDLKNTDDITDDDYVGNDSNDGNDGNDNIDDLDDLMIAQSKAQIRSDYRRSLGKEFVRRLK